MKRMIEQLELFKRKMRELRGSKSMHQMSKDLDLPSIGSYRGLEIYGNPQFLSLLRMTKQLNLEITIKKGKWNIKNF